MRVFGNSEMMIMRGFICERNHVNVLNCRTSQHQHIYSSTTVYQRVSLILQTENNYLPFMRPKKLNMLCLLAGISFLSSSSILLPTRKSGIRRDKYLSAAIFKEAVHSDDS